MLAYVDSLAGEHWNNQNDRNLLHQLEGWIAIKRRVSKQSDQRGYSWNDYRKQ